MEDRLAVGRIINERAQDAKRQNTLVILCQFRPALRFLYFGNLSLRIPVDNITINNMIKRIEGRRFCRILDQIVL